MRELKFRAWVEWTGKPEFHYSDKEYPDAFWNVCNDGDNLEQYTGLKDKNGKEIYEGDIVEEKIDTGDSDIDGTYRYKVVWDDDMLCWSLYPNDTSIHKDLWECNQSLEVIGNIHENPELLGGEE